MLATGHATAALGVLAHVLPPPPARPSQPSGLWSFLIMPLALQARLWSRALFHATSVQIAHALDAKLENRCFAALLAQASGER